MQSEPQAQLAHYAGLPHCARCPSIPRDLLKHGDSLSGRRYAKKVLGREGLKLLLGTSVGGIWVSALAPLSPVVETRQGGSEQNVTLLPSGLHRRPATQESGDLSTYLAQEILALATLSLAGS